MNMAKDLQTKPTGSSPVKHMVETLEKRQDDVKTMLPPNVSIDRFMRTIKNAILRDPKIAEADPTTVFLECQKAAQDGLVLDGREAVLTRFNTKKRWKEDGSWREKWVTAVTYIPMAYGIMKRVRNSGKVSSWFIGVVYEGEVSPDKDGNVRFKYFAGDNPRIEHEPIIIGDKGEAVAFYSSVKLSDGTYHHDVMSVEDVNRIMNRTKSRNSKGEIVGPWSTDYVEMGKKTVMKRHAKRLPMSGEDIEVLDRDNSLYDLNRRSDGSYGDDPAPVKAIENKKKTSAADKLKKAAEEELEQSDEVVDGDVDAVDAEYIDPETGEVSGGDDEEDAQSIDPEDEF